MKFTDSWVPIGNGLIRITRHEANGDHREIFIMIAGDAPEKEVNELRNFILEKLAPSV